MGGIGTWAPTFFLLQGGSLARDHGSWIVRIFLSQGWQCGLRVKHLLGTCEDQSLDPPAPHSWAAMVVCLQCQEWGARDRDPWGELAR